MSSNSIYTTVDRVKYEDFNIPIKYRKEGEYEPFVYIIEETSSKRKYIGCRYADNCLVSDLGTIYFTSSKEIEWKDNLHSYVVLDIYQCETNYDAIILEEELITNNNAVRSSDYINLAHPSIGFSGGRPGFFTAIDQYGNKFFISREDERYINGELHGQRKGQKMPEDFCLGASNRMKDKVAVKDKDENFYLVETTDPRYISGELVPIATGREVSEETRKKISESNKNKVVSPETRKKMSQSRIGRFVSEETRQKLSDANKGKKRTPEQNKRNSIAQLGKKVSEEVKSKISSSISKKKWINNKEINKRVDVSDVDFYLSDGWILGRVKKDKTIVDLE